MHPILIANGVNLDLLGQRPAQYYGHDSLTQINARLSQFRAQYEEQSQQKTPKLEFFQTNEEGLFLNKLSQNYSGIILNPGAWTHTSLALADRLEALNKIVIEVHLSNLLTREDLRKTSLIAPFCKGTIMGFGAKGYELALQALLDLLTSSSSSDS